jgi:hypothetical protein
VGSAPQLIFVITKSGRLGARILDPVELFTGRPRSHHRAQVPSSFAFHYAKAPLRRPRLDDQQRRLRVQPGGDDLGNVGKKQISART